MYWRLFTTACTILVPLVIGVAGFSQPAHAVECEILSAEIRSLVQREHNESNRETATIEVKTKDCTDIHVAIFEWDGAFGVANIIPLFEDKNGPTWGESTGKKFTIPSGTDTLSLSIRLSEDQCESSENPNCEYYLVVTKPGQRLIRGYNTRTKPNGLISYNCDPNDSRSPGEKCDKAVMEIISVNSGTPTPTSTVSTEGCWDASTGKNRPGCYELLTDIPLKDDQGNQVKVIDTSKVLGEKEWTLAGLINSFFGFAIGIAGVLAVVMMIIYAWQYLTTDIPNLKTLLKEKIGKVLLGLLLLLGIYTILRTINPELLRVDFKAPKLSTDTGGVSGVNFEPKKMVPVGEGTIDIFSSVVAESTVASTGSLSFSVTARLKNGVQPPPDGLQIRIGTSPETVQTAYTMQPSLGPLFVYTFTRTKARPDENEIRSTWYYRITEKKPGGKQIIIPEAEIPDVPQQGDVGDDDVDNLIEEVAREEGFDVCILKAIVEQESRGDVNAIGHDENARRSDSPSRFAFLRSAEKYDGELFTRVDPTVNQGYKANIFNNDSTSADLNSPTLGLDWRFAHGIGLFQITVFPDRDDDKDGRKDILVKQLDYEAKSEDRERIPSEVINGKRYTPRDLLDPKTNVRAAIDRIRENSKRRGDGEMCGGNTQLVFKAYNGGNCATTSPSAITYGEETMIHYNECKAKLAEQVVVATEEEGGEETTSVSCNNPPDPLNNNQAFIVWINQCYTGSPKTLQTTVGGSLDVPPCDEANFITIDNVFGGKSIYIHRALKPSIERISQKYVDQGGPSSYPINDIGGYFCRYIANTQTLSNHAFGLAVDVNYTKNPYITNLSTIDVNDRTTYTDMPEWFVDLWKAEGYGWGGDWNTKKDAMHFSKLQNEKGDGIVEPVPDII